jgi:hypothetical protein
MQMFREVPSAPVSLISLAAVTILALWVAIRAVTAREYVLEQ